MLSTAYYFLQVTLCSGIMLAYYWLVLRNKRFHQYNRFYLLAVAVLSWIIPLIKIEWNMAYTDDQQMIRFLSVVAGNNSEIEAVFERRGFHWGTESILAVLYWSVVVILLLMMVQALWRIYGLLKTHSCKNIGDVYLIITQAKGTPFSFFRYIFWNDEIDIRSESGKQILQHELTHVRQRHSIDKMLVQVVLMMGWFNPVFWLLKKEMELIHEFIADRKAVGDGDTAALAQMLLTAVYPQQHFNLTHPFFFSPIKRRLQMLTNHKNPRFSYLRRLIILPLLAIMVVLFAFRNKEYRQNNPISVETVMESIVNSVKPGTEAPLSSKINRRPFVRLNKSYKIVINPGHGGEDKGAIATDGTTEAVMALEFARMIKASNKNPQLEIILTRDQDEFMPLVQLAEQVNGISPDLMVSIHLNNESGIRNRKNMPEGPKKGSEIYIAERTKSLNYDQSYQLANWLGNTLQVAGSSFRGIKTREKGIYLLQALKCPSALIETGYMSHKEEFAKLKDPAYRQNLVNAILLGIEQFLLSKEKKNTTSTATADAKWVMPVDMTFRNVSYDETPYDQFRKKYHNPDDYIVVLNGKKVKKDILEKLDPNTIHEIKVFKDEATILKYGEKGISGVIEVTFKSKHQPVIIDSNEHNATPSRRVYDTVVVSGSKRQVDETTLSFKDVTLYETDKYDLNTAQKKLVASRYRYVKEPGVRAVVRTSKREIDSRPGQTVKKYVLIPAQKAASFPGGEPGWQKYLQQNLKASIAVENGADTGKYVAEVSFIVNANGSIQDVRIEKDPGYGTAAEVMRIIKEGPNWKPAMQHNKAVASRASKTVTFTISE